MKKNYELPKSYHLGSEGCGCAGEPPCYPLYFVKPIFTQYGNNPSYKQPQYYLDGNGYNNLDEVSKLYGTKKYPKLSLDHPRTRAWILDKYRHHQHCYYNPNRVNNHDIIVYPVPSYKLKKFYDDERFSDEWREREKTSIEQYNNEIIRQAKEICIPENHSAVVLIRKYYPEYQPELDLIENPPKVIETWWARHEEKPTPETCKGEPWKSHPVNGNWCQVCGWHSEE